MCKNRVGKSAFKPPSANEINNDDDDLNTMDVCIVFPKMQGIVYMKMS